MCGVLQLIVYKCELIDPVFWISGRTPACRDEPAISWIDKFNQVFRESLVFTILTASYALEE